MELIGAFNPKIPVNAFVTPVYADEDGILKTHMIRDERITEYVKIEIDNRKKDIIFLTGKKTLPVRDSIPFFCYYKELPGKGGQLIYGTKLELEEKLLGFLFDDKLNINAKIIISSFFDLVNVTAAFIDKGNEMFKESKVNIFLKKEYLIPTQEATSETIRDVRSFFWKAESFLKRDARFSWKSILLFLNDHFHFMEYYYSPQDFKEIVPSRHLLAIKEAIRDIIEKKMASAPNNAFLEINQNLGDVYQHLERREMNEVTYEKPVGILTLARAVKENRKKLEYS